MQTNQPVDPSFLAQAQKFSATLAGIGHEVHNDLQRVAGDSLPRELAPLARKVLRAPGHITALFLTCLGSPATTFVASCFWLWRIVYVLAPAFEVLSSTSAKKPHESRAEIEKRLSEELGKTQAALFVGALLTTIVSIGIFILTTSLSAFCAMPLAATGTWYLAKKLEDHPLIEPELEQLALQMDFRVEPQPYPMAGGPLAGVKGVKVLSVHYPKISMRD